ncbi:hypothetical protein IQ62_25915 [Streptomyces scabiei]|uniref:hypothetical protein n=1 Tax=Streptomyces scabiei TaxID=1930 RepID=UPI0004E72E56|nr:hypothetical protein [Streptomyces scabiei]KFF98270.1 hypothetical protein IQ62_25915 [Streptomyces scabiei]
MTAAVLLLAAAVLVHFATPHHASDSMLSVSAMAPAIESEPRKPYDPEPVSDHACAASGHHELVADAPALPPRAAGPAVQLPAVAGIAVADAVTPGGARPGTARDARNPSAGTAPTLSTLQTFRC